jgi:hypothetical protein
MCVFSLYILSETFPILRGNEWDTVSGVPTGGLGGSNPLKFQSFDKAEPNSQFHEKYIRNNQKYILVFV